MHLKYIRKNNKIKYLDKYKLLKFNYSSYTIKSRKTQHIKTEILCLLLKKTCMFIFQIKKKD